MSFRNYYDSTSYGRSREPGRGAAGVSERPTSVTAKYSNITPTYKSSSIPVLAKDEAPSPISAIASRYANYNKTDKNPKKDFDKTTTASKYDKKDYLDKPTSKYEKKDYDKPISKFEKKDYIDKPTSKYEKKDYSKLTIPSLSTSRSRDVSPISTSSKYSLSRPSRHLSPERRTNKNYKDKSRDPSPADREKDIPSKTDKSTGYNSLSSYKLYPRSSSYTRPASRTETKPDINVNRYSISNRLSSNYLRSPPTATRTSVSPVNHTDSGKDSKSMEKSVSPVVPSSPTTVNEGNETKKEASNEVLENGTETIVEEVDENETETVIVITRHTSPTPPGSSAYVRSRRADMAKTIEKSLTRSKARPQMVDKEIQSDRLDDPTRTSRFGSTARASTTNWSYYGPNSTNYTGYAGRHLTQYAALRENSSQSYSDRSSRSQSNERLPKDSSNSQSHSENTKEVEKPISPLNDIPESNQEIFATYEQTKDEDTSEIIINVNLKLKKTNSPMVAALAELVSPEITITNSQLPPQAPKPEGAVKTKKVKLRKSSTDSSDSGSKKKIVKRKTKSGSSIDSDPGSDMNERTKDSNSLPKSNMANSSNSSLQNGHSKIRHSKSRESNSPESMSTLSTQSSVSEDDTVSKSKTNDARTSADEQSIPTDRSPKQSSPVVSQKTDNTEEAKSFLIRALAPVTNLFKMRSQDSTESKTLPESSTSESTGKDVSNLITESERSSKNKNNTSNIIASNDDNVVKLKAIRHIESGERAWWLDSPSDKPNTEQSSDIRSPSEKNIPKKIRHIESGERAWWLESNSESKHDNQTSQTQPNTSESTDPNKPFKKYKFGEEEKPWWLDSAANIPEGVERLSPPRKSSSESEKSEKFNFFKVRHIESGEQKDWWLTSNENSSNNKSEGQNSHSQSQTESDQKSFPLRRIRHVESGERPWWLSSNKNIPEGIEKLPTPPPQGDSDSSDSEEVQAYATPAQIPPFPLHLPDDEPLGTRRSPEGLETPKENENYHGRTSPYENNRQYMRNLYQNGPEKYVSRYTDMEDFMGDKQRYSPFMARRTGVPYDDDECKEIDPTQVRIHDSTAQMPVIKKVRGRGEVVDYRDEDQLDDGSLHVYKDGDYGSYLDLESAQGEQDDREGLQNRLNDESLMKRNHSINSKKPNDLAKSSNHDAETRVGSPRLPPITDNKENKELSTALRRRRDRHARQAHHITQQQELLNNSHSIFNGLFGSSKGNHNGTNGTNGYTNQINGQDEEPYRTTKPINLGNVLKNGNQRYTAGLKQRIQNGNLGDSVNALDALTVIRQKQIDSPEVKEDRGIIINREHSIKDLAQRLTSPVSPTTEDKPIRVSDMSGIVSKAKEELAKSQSKEVIKSPTREIAPKVHEIKISENDLHWEELRKGCLNREFHLCDLDFSDLRLDSDEDADSPSSNALGIPPPPPPGLICFPPPPTTFPTSRNIVPAPPPKPPLSSEYSQDSDSSNFKKNKKTVKLFWREIHESPAPITFRTKQEGLIWDDLPEVRIDTSMLEQLFESKSNDLILKKLMEPKRNLILDTKRSNAINIAMKKLPTPQTIKTAILKMDATVIGREGIEKLMTMLPTEEETIKIQEAQCANPDLPLGSAEQFLLTLASISELPRRLKLWVFKLDFDNLEKEIAEPLMDLKQGIELLKVNKTFKVILSTLRSVGSFLNGSQVKGFRLEYLAKVMEVKDTVHKHPLLYHVCEMIIDKFPDTTDFFSEVGPVIRASKVDFDALTSTLQKLETDCKASWDHLKRVAEDDSSSVFATKFNEFLTDAAERIILLSIVFKRVMSRFNKFLLYMGVPPGDVSKTKPSEFLKVIAEFALEYRTTRERVLLQLEKKANHRERNKAKKIVIDVSPYSSRNGDHSAADSALKQLLNTDADIEGRRKSMHAITNGDFSADDEIIESLVRSAASKRRPAQSRKNRISHKKNLTRCRDGKDS